MFFPCGVLPVFLPCLVCSSAAGREMRVRDAEEMGQFVPTRNSLFFSPAVANCDVMKKMRRQRMRLRRRAGGAACRGAALCLLLLAAAGMAQGRAQVRHAWPCAASTLHCIVPTWRQHRLQRLRGGGRTGEGEIRLQVTDEASGATAYMSFAAVAEQGEVTGCEASWVDHDMSAPIEAADDLVFLAATILNGDARQSSLWFVPPHSQQVDARFARALDADTAGLLWHQLLGAHQAAMSLVLCRRHVGHASAHAPLDVDARALAHDNAHGDAYQVQQAAPTAPHLPHSLQHPDQLLHQTETAQQGLGGHAAARPVAESGAHDVEHSQDEEEWSSQDLKQSEDVEQDVEQASASTSLPSSAPSQPSAPHLVQPATLNPGPQRGLAHQAAKQSTREPSRDAEGARVQAREGAEGCTTGREQEQGRGEERRLDKLSIYVKHHETGRKERLVLSLEALRLQAPALPAVSLNATCSGHASLRQQEADEEYVLRAVWLRGRARFNITRVADLGLFVARLMHLDAPRCSLFRQAQGSAAHALLLSRIDSHCTGAALWRLLTHDLNGPQMAEVPCLVIGPHSLGPHSPAPQTLGPFQTHAATVSWHASDSRSTRTLRLHVPTSTGIRGMRARCVSQQLVRQPLHETPLHIHLAASYSSALPPNAAHKGAGAGGAFSGLVRWDASEEGLLGLNSACTLEWTEGQMRVEVAHDEPIADVLKLVAPVLAVPSNTSVLVLKLPASPTVTTPAAKARRGKEGHYLEGHYLRVRCRYTSQFVALCTLLSSSERKCELQLVASSDVELRSHISRLAQERRQAMAFLPKSFGRSSPAQARKVSMLHVEIDKMNLK